MISAERRAIERLSVRFVVVAAAVVLVALLAPMAWHYLSPFIIALPFAAMVQPVVGWLEKKLHLKHAPAVMIPVVILVLVLMAALVWFVIYIAGQIRVLVSSGSVRSAITSLQTTLNELTASADTLSENGQTFLTELVNGISGAAMEAVKQLSGSATNVAVGSVLGIPDALIYANFLIIGLYFVAKEYGLITSILPHHRKHVESGNAADISRSAMKGAIGYIKMQLFYAVIALIAGYFFWTAVRNPYASLIAITAFILEFIPIVGNGTIYIPWAIIALLLGNPRGAAQPALLYGCLFFFRRLTEPKLLSHTIGVPPLLSLVGMFAGYTAGGIIGLVAGPVVAAVVYAIWRGKVLEPAFDDIRTVRRWLLRRWSDRNQLPAPGQAPENEGGPWPDDDQPQDKVPEDEAPEDEAPEEEDPAGTGQEGDRA